MAGTVFPSLLKDGGKSDHSVKMFNCQLIILMFFWSPGNLVLLIVPILYQVCNVCSKLINTYFQLNFYKI